MSSRSQPSEANVLRVLPFGIAHLEYLHFAITLSLTPHDRVERPATLPLAACRAIERPVGN
jgi:hypothetical protein